MNRWFDTMPEGETLEAFKERGNTQMLFYGPLVNFTEREWRDMHARKLDVHSIACGINSGFDYQEAASF